MVERNISQEFRFKNIDKTKNYFVEEIKENKFLSKKNKKVCRTLNYIEHLLILACVAAGCISIFAFAALLGISIEIVNSAKGLKICSKLQELKSISQQPK